MMPPTPPRSVEELAAAGLTLLYVLGQLLSRSGEELSEDEITDMSRCRDILNDWSRHLRESDAE